jgi:uncharacterized protein (TIGR02444 family)
MARDKSDTAEAFWRFSLLVYSRPGVVAALIGLQDRAGHNVNLMLFALWLAIGRGRRLDAAGLARARAAIEKLDCDVVQPLRRLRRELKGDLDPDVQGMRRRILVLEVAAERHVQARLAAVAGARKTKGGHVALAEVNLRVILGDDFESSEGVMLSAAIAAF